METDSMPPVTLVLIHSPLVGPSTWSRVADVLRQRGVEARVPALLDREADPRPSWQQHADSVAQALTREPVPSEPWLVGHSGAGALLPAIRQGWGHPAAGYGFVDAGIPVDGCGRLETPEAQAFAQRLRPHLLAGGRYPDWTDATLRELLPDPQLRQTVLAEVQPRALPFWEEPIPVFPGWPDAPAFYLHFSAAYDHAARRAQQAGWAYRHLPAGHFHMLVDPVRVAEALLALVRQAAGPTA